MFTQSNENKSNANDNEWGDEESRDPVLSVAGKDLSTFILAKCGNGCDNYL